MEGLSPVYNWLQPFDGSTNTFPALQLPDWNYGLDQWPEFYAPGQIGPYEQSLFPHVPSGAVDHSGSQLDLAADAFDEDHSRQLTIHETVEPDQLHISSLPNHVDSRFQYFADPNGGPDVNERVSDWLAKSQPETQHRGHDQHVRLTDDCLTEVAALKSEVAQLQKCLRDAQSAIDAIERQDARFVEVRQQVEALMKWAVEVSTTFNDFQLKEQGMSPLQKHFGLVLGPKLKKKP